MELIGNCPIIIASMGYGVSVIGWSYKLDLSKKEILSLLPIIANEWIVARLSINGEFARMVDFLLTLL